MAFEEGSDLLGFFNCLQLGDMDKGAGARRVGLCVSSLF